MATDGPLRTPSATLLSFIFFAVLHRRLNSPLWIMYVLTSFKGVGLFHTPTMVPRTSLPHRQSRTAGFFVSHKDKLYTRKHAQNAWSGWLIGFHPYPCRNIQMKTLVFSRVNWSSWPLQMGSGRYDFGKNKTKMKPCVFRLNADLLCLINQLIYQSKHLRKHYRYQAIAVGSDRNEAHKHTGIIKFSKQ